MKTALPVIMLCLLGLTACDGSGDEFNDNISSRAEPKLRIFPDDSDIIAKVYDNHYRVPGDFFVDERASTPGTFSFYHVKDASVSYELCTNEYQEALDWEAADNSSRAAGGEFVGSFENDNYFEFARELTAPESIGNIANPTSSGFARIFKCNYVDRVGVDRNLRNGYAGTINRSPLSGAVIRDYSQYMWQFTFFWPAEKTVLETFSTEQANVYQHTLLLAFVTHQGTDRCDLIEVVDWVFSMDKTDGKIVKEFNLLYQMEAQVLNGIPELCRA